MTNSPIIDAVCSSCSLAHGWWIARLDDGCNWFGLLALTPQCRTGIIHWRDLDCYTAPAHDAAMAHWMLPVALLLIALGMALPVAMIAGFIVAVAWAVPLLLELLAGNDAPISPLRASLFCFQ